jgi:predicted KAP-like P-loop ATPase
VWSDNETNTDLLRFGYLASAVGRIVRSDRLLPTTVGVFGDWGSGKSSLLKMIQAELERDPNVMCLSFDGWLFEGYEDAKTALMGTILDAIEDRTKGDTTLWEKVKERLQALRRLMHNFLDQQIG